MSLDAMIFVALYFVLGYNEFFRVGILPDRLPISPSGRAITVTRDGLFGWEGGALNI
jgi:hypothetical protein